MSIEWLNIEPAPVIDKAVKKENLSKLITDRGFTGWSIKTEGGWKRIEKIVTLTESKAVHGSSLYNTVVPEGEKTYIRLEGSSYTEYGETYYKRLNAKEAPWKDVTYPYEFRDANGIEVLVCGVTEEVSKQVDLWTL